LAAILQQGATTDTSRKSYSIPEICRRNDTSRSTIYEEIRRGRLRVRKLGRRSIVTDDDERAWLDALPVLELE
jgi:predicted DNA-binding protein YlxM (UPF0122 family)